MDHAYVEEHDIAQAYLAGRLADEERDAFEAHYFACEACLERLELENGFREGMLEVAAQDLTQAAAARTRLGLLAAFAALSRRHRLVLAAAFLLLAALPALWLAGRNRALAERLAAAADSERQRAALAARLASLEQAGSSARRGVEEELARARAAAARPQVNVPLFLLAAVRSGEPGREPVNQLPLAPGDTSVILTAELATVDYPAYRAALQNAGGQEIWQAQGLHPDSRDTLVVLLPTSLVPPGVYRLTIAGAAGGGKWVDVAAYPFRVALRP